MQVTKTQPSPTTAKLKITAGADELAETKQAVLERLGASVKVAGFRPGKAPANLIEKQLEPHAFQAEFLEQVVNRLYVEAIQKEKLRPAAQPKIDITKFVPFSTLEFTAEVESVGDIKLPNYKLIKVEAQKPTVSAQDVNDVLNNLRQRGATKQAVQRAAKDGDEAVIDFKGVDAATKEAIDGADGKEYPLALGSKTFIPGFEDQLIGLKPGEKKTFDLAFPADYGVKTLQSRKVTFEVTVLKVSELKPPALDDKFAASVGPFKTLADLKADIKKQLTTEKQNEAERQFNNDLIEKIAAKTTVAIPKSLVEEEIDRMEEEEKRNIVYRGQTWQEHLESEGLTADQHREKQREGAELRVKAGLVLGAIADAEKIDVTPEELEIRMQLLKGQYPDPSMQAELDKPEARRDIHSRMMTEKTLEKLRSYSAKAATPKQA